MFVDLVKLVARSGDGGPGSASFRREKFEPRGGPDGGNGGDGGDVMAEVDAQLNTLLDLRYRDIVEGEPGGRGAKNNRTGHRGQEGVIRVPPGTVIRNAETAEVLADLTHGGERVVLLTGGRGGKGNTHFKSPTRQAPEYAQPGTSGKELAIELELKLIADVGLVGLPNAGKSTLLSRISAARPKIADYPFTTIEPNLGIVRVGDYDTLVVADIPGLIEGAHEGKGLGMRFLRHIERTRVLCFLLDAGAEDPASDLEVLNNELRHFSSAILKKPSVLVVSKIDLISPEQRVARIGGKAVDHHMSSATGEGVDELIRLLDARLKEARKDEEDGSDEDEPRKEKAPYRP